MHLRDELFSRFLWIHVFYFYFLHLFIHMKYLSSATNTLARSYTQHKTGRNDCG